VRQDWCSNQMLFECIDIQIILALVWPHKLHAVAFIESNALKYNASNNIYMHISLIYEQIRQ